MVLVTGGAGFIGAHTAARLLREGHEVAVLDPLRMHPPSLELNELASLRFRRESLLCGAVSIAGSTADKSATLRALLEVRPRHVVHLGARPLATDALERSEQALDSIVRGTFNLLLAAQEVGTVEKLVYVSSSMVYGDFRSEPQAEEAETSPKEVYGGMKLAAEILVKVFSQTSGLQYVIVRPTAVYGPTDVNGRIVQRIVDAAVLGRPLRLVNPATTRLDFTYVEDVAEGLRLALLSPIVNETFNVSAGRGRSIAELYELVRRRFPRLEAEMVEQADDFRPRRGTLDITKARSLLGYEPRYQLEVGIDAYLEFAHRCREEESSAASAASSPDSLS
jgi:nucleoside-diphosphate-sugar epimerase